MSDFDDVTKELLRKVFSVDVDVQFRSLALQQQCDKLQSICQHIRGVHISQADTNYVQQTETSAVEQSIQDAIRHARQVRVALAIQNSDFGKEYEIDHTGNLDTEEKQLHSIISIAKEARAAQSLELKKSKTEQVKHQIRLAYPEQLKPLEEYLEDLRAKEKKTSTRFTFCCKVNERLAVTTNRKKFILQQQQKLGSPRSTDNLIVPIQTSFPKQVSRLQIAYQRLMEFLLEKVAVGSNQLELVANAPSFSTVFPTYHRIKQAKKMHRLLNNEAKSLLERMPQSPPKLSQAAIAHRDAMLSKIRKKKSHPDIGVIDNKVLLTAREAELYQPNDNKLLEKLQAAWIAREPATAKNTRAGNSVVMYSTTVREIVLTELSNAVLWSFKTYFADTAERPGAMEIQAVMRLIRLVDSVALSNSRTFRSVIDDNTSG